MYIYTKEQKTMKKFSRRIWLVITAVLAGALLWGCGSDDKAVEFKPEDRFVYFTGLTGEQKARVEQLAEQKGYTVTKDASGNTVIQKEDLPTEPAKQEDVNNILSSASVSDLSNVSPSDYSRIYQAAKDNGATAVSKPDGSVEIVQTVPTTVPPRRVTTTAPGGRGTTAGTPGTAAPNPTTAKPVAT